MMDGRKDLVVSPTQNTLNYNWSELTVNALEPLIGIWLIPGPIGQAFDGEAHQVTVHLKELQ